MKKKTKRADDTPALLALCGSLLRDAQRWKIARVGGAWTRRAPTSTGFYFIALPAGHSAWAGFLVFVVDDSGTLKIESFRGLPYQPLGEVAWEDGLWWSEKIVIPRVPVLADPARRIARAADLVDRFAEGESSRKDIREIATLLRAGEGELACRLARSLDTFDREGIPRLAWEVLDSFVSEEV